jgi:oligoendopeptidase F
MKTRDQIDEKYKLNTKELFSSKKEFLQELENLNKEIEKVTKYEGHILDNSTNLYELLELTEELDKKLERIYTYANLNNDFDLANKESNELYGLAFKLYKDYVTLSSYIVPELLESDYSIITKYLKEDSKLKKYERMLKEIYRSKEHILSKQEEYILSKLTDVFKMPEDAHSKLTDVDLTFGYVKDENGKRIELNESVYPALIESKNRNVRKSCFKKFYKGYESVINTTTELLASNVKINNAISSLRKYNSALASSLDSNEVDICVYNNLMDSINNHLSTIYREWDIRKKALGVKDLHLYDTYVPLADEYDKKYTYEEASNLIEETLKVLGDDYVSIIKRAFNENWIDVYPNKNKRGGAYCTNCYLTHPYVLTNFDGRFGDVSTIIHELGHAMHYYYAAKNNSYVDYNYSIFVAEVASQVNEILLCLHIFNKSKEKKEKLFILDELIKHFKSSVVRQSMFAEFELTIHEKDQAGDILTCQNLCDTYYNINKKYFGPNVYIDDEIKYEWSRIPHFYYNFYVYQYATGYIAALKIASDLYENKEGALDKYLHFLSLGCTMNPVDSLKVAGVDLTKKETFDASFNVFAKQMDEFEKLIREE